MQSLQAQAQEQITPENIATINNLIQNSADYILCDPNCQKKRQEDKLYKEYQDAIVNVKSAPQKVNDTEKQYYTFIGEEYKYNEKIDTQYEKDANYKISKIMEQIESKIKIIKNTEQENNLILDNIDNINRLIHIDDKEHNTYYGLTDNINDIETNDRKIYYKTISANTTKHKYFPYVIFYFLVSIIYAIYLFIDNEIPFIKKLGIIILIILYPLLVDYALKFIINFFTSLATYIYKFVNVGI